MKSFNIIIDLLVKKL